MKELSIDALVHIIKGRTEIDTSPDPRARSLCFTSVSTDSRTTKAGDCFFAIIGDNFDGHDYVCDAFAKGAVCAVVSKDIDEEKSTGKCLLKVEDTRLSGKNNHEANNSSRLEPSFSCLSVTREF